MKYIVRCKKTLYCDTTSNSFGNSRKKMAKQLIYVDVFNNFITLIAKKDQIAIVDTTKTEEGCKLDLLSGGVYNINVDVLREYFDPIYLDDTCFETRTKLNKKGIQ